MDASLRLGRVFGIPLGVNYSWFAILAFLTVILAQFNFPARAHDWPIAAYWSMGLLASLLFFGCVVGHELAHCAVAIASGIPVKGITLFIFGGVAQLEREPVRPRDEFFMALAGPLASFAFGLLFGVLYLVSPPFSQPLAELSRWMAMVNISLAVFNLFPGFPLDGGRVLRSIIWWLNGNHLRATEIASNTGRAGGYLFMVGGLLLMFYGMPFEGIWITFVGWFLGSIARSGYRQTVVRHSLEGLTARDMMSSDFPQVEPTLSVSDLVREHFLRSAQRTYLVVENGEPLGLVTPQSLKGLRQERWADTTVREITIPLASLKKASASEDAASVLDRMDALNLAQLPVEQEGRIVGLVRKDSFLQLIRIRGEIGV